MGKQEKESKQEGKRGFPRCTFKTNLIIGLLISFPAVTLLVFMLPDITDCITIKSLILKRIVFILIYGTIASLLSGGFSWLMFDFE